MNFRELQKLYSEMQLYSDKIQRDIIDGVCISSEIESYHLSLSKFYSSCRKFFGNPDASNDELLELFENKSIRTELIDDIIYFKLWLDGCVTPLQHEIYNLSSIEDLEELRERLRRAFNKKTSHKLEKNIF